jgi:hypothetical protein
MHTTPCRELCQLSGGRQADVARHVEFHAWRERDSAPHRSFERRFRLLALARPCWVIQRVPDLVERPAPFLQRFDLQESIKVFGAVMIAAADPMGFGEQAFLDVVPHRPARHTAQVCEIANGVARVIRHGRFI